MTRILVAALFVVAALAPIASAAPPLPAPSTKDNLVELTVDQVQAHLGDPRFHVFDDNPKDVYMSGHVPTAKWVNYTAVSASDLPTDKGDVLVFYCANEH